MYNCIFHNLISLKFGHSRKIKFQKRVNITNQVKLIPKNRGIEVAGTIEPMHVKVWRSGKQSH